MFFNEHGFQRLLEEMRLSKEIDTLVKDVEEDGEKERLTRYNGSFGKSILCFSSLLVSVYSKNTKNAGGKYMITTEMKLDGIKNRRG